MSDTNFMNAYVNVILETIHSNLNESMNMKAQLKVLNDLITQKDQIIQDLTSQKDQVIQDLTSRIDSLNNQNEGHRTNEGALHSEMQTLRDNAASWESRCNSVMSKVAEMDTLIKQYNELKNQYIEKQTECEQLTEQIESLKTKNTIKPHEQLVVQPLSKKVINKESSSKTLSPAKKVENIPRENDDF